MNHALFHDLYERYATDVFRFAYWLAGNRAEADDITAETFARAWAGRDRIRTETVKAYLLAIARNLYLQQRRRQAREVRLDRAVQMASAERPPDVVQKKEAWQEVMQHLQRLSETDRAALLLRAQYDLSYAEIARVLSISLAAAKVRVHRARLKLEALRAIEEVTADENHA